MNFFLRQDEAQEAEAKQVLHSIHDIREQVTNQDPAAMATIGHALAMLYFLLDDIPKVITGGTQTQDEDLLRC